MIRDIVVALGMPEPTLRTVDQLVRYLKHQSLIFAVGEKFQDGSWPIALVDRQTTPVDPSCYADPTFEDMHVAYLNLQHIMYHIRLKEPDYQWPSTAAELKLLLSLNNISISNLHQVLFDMHRLNFVQITPTNLLWNHSRSNSTVRLPESIQKRIVPSSILMKCRSPSKVLTQKPTEPPPAPPSHLGSVAHSDLESTLHDRQRRQERQIKKIDQQRARRFGMREPGRHGRIKYTLGGMVFIWDPVQNRSVTSWQIENGEIPKTGTRYTDPVMLMKSSQHESADILKKREKIQKAVARDKGKWKSHTVLVVDMSGSMRRDDVDGARCRSDGVWMCLARDFVQKQLEEGKSTIYDVVSVIVMREEAELVLFCEPTDYVLYNKLVDFREWTNIRPEGPGNYRPCLEMAENLLNVNKLGSCAISLFFFSDGKPSDRVDGLAEKMGDIASKFGRRLTVCCVGMASQDEDFSMLEEMAKEAEAFGAVGSFNKPTMSADSLSSIISTHVSSLTTTKTELTDLATGTTRTVRTDIVRERVGAPDDLALSAEWRVFRECGPCYVSSVWAWQKKKNSFAQLMDRRCRTCFRPAADENMQLIGHAVLCSRCSVCLFCTNCFPTSGYGNHSYAECLEMATKRRQGLYLKEVVVPSYSVALKKTVFGEGAERLAYKFRYLNAMDQFVGPVMVAKESKFVEDHGTKEDSARYMTSSRRNYHELFMRTQALAAKFANLYNESLNEVSDLFGPHHKDRFRKFPRIHFLQPLIFEMVDQNERNTYNVLVEPMLEGTYKKYNNNFGDLPKVQVRHETPENVEQESVDILLGRKSGGCHPEAPQLDIINEDEDEDTDDEEAEYIPSPSETNEGSRKQDNAEFFDAFIVEGRLHDKHRLASTHISDDDFAQAFSHFSYVRSGGKLIVVDLQGTIKVHPDGRREFLFTDPAIHNRHSRKKGLIGLLNGMNFGRTDRGRKGIQAFFSTHICNEACRLFALRPKNSASALPGEDVDPKKSR